MTSAISKKIRGLISGSQPDMSSANMASGKVDRMTRFGQGTSFTLYNAIGGKIVQVNRGYDFANDVDNTSVYIIPEGADIGEEIGLILTREFLCR